MRSLFFAFCAAAALMVTGCGGSTPAPPPPGADTAETPDIDVDPGIVAPGEDTDAAKQEEGDTATEEAKQEETP